MSIESRIERLEARFDHATQASRQVHFVFVYDCSVDDDAHNEAAQRRALAANPPPEGARVTSIQFVTPKKYRSRDEP